jgi:CRP/FNR family cyclic AMP-dependent transcriptional regulator
MALLSLKAKKPAERLDFFASLKDVGLFSDLKSDENALLALSEIMTERAYSAGADIIHEGDQGAEMFILISGQASVYKSTPGGDEYKVAVLKHEFHAAFGESGLIESEQRTATIRADQDCKCLVMSRSAFEKFSVDHPQWALPVYRRIAHGVMSRLRNTNNDMLLLYNALVAEIRGH